jgi:hypothetical protein
VSLVLIEFSMQDDGMTRASGLAASSSTCPLPSRIPTWLQDVQDLESDPEIEMEDVEADDLASSDFGRPIGEANSATDEEDDNSIDNQERFRNNKA